MRPAKRPNSQAFALLELLVVLAILSVLLGLLFPVMSMARIRARQTQCAANLRSIYSALLSYAQESRGWMPRNSGKPNSEATSFAIIAARRLGFPDANETSAKRIAVLQCPEFPRAQDVPGCYVSNALALIDDVTPPGEYLTEQSQLGGIRKPASVIYLIDMSDRFLPLEMGLPDSTEYLLHHDVWAPFMISDHLVGHRVATRRHGKRVNAIMFDGSVQSLSGEQHQLGNYDDGRRGVSARRLLKLPTIRGIWPPRQ